MARPFKIAVAIAKKTVTHRLKSAVKKVFKPSKKPNINLGQPAAADLKGMTSSQYWQLKNLKKKWWFPRKETRANMMQAGVTQLGSLSNTGALMLALKLKGDTASNPNYSTHTPTSAVTYNSSGFSAPPPGLMSVPNYG